MPDLQDMLDNAGAILKRDRKHLVYSLPNGKTFTRSKTPSDRRQEQNAIHDLRRLLPKQEKTMETFTEPDTEYQSLVNRPVMQEIATEVVNDASPPTLRQKIERHIADKIKVSEYHMAEAQKADRAAEALKKLLEYADDEGMADALKGLLFEQPVAKPMTLYEKNLRQLREKRNKPTLPTPPDRITDRVQITAQLVVAASHTFPGNFTTNDLVDIMTGGKMVDGDEKLRIRSCICSMMSKLVNDGRILRIRRGIGHRQALWHKADLQSINGVRG